jgi:hypothetical protein
MVLAFHGEIGPDSKQSRVFVVQSHDVLFCAGAPAHRAALMVGEALVYAILAKDMGTRFQYTHIRWNLYANGTNEVLGDLSEGNRHVVFCTGRRLKRKKMGRPASY